jgi:acyl carrier protein
VSISSAKIIEYMQQDLAVDTADIEVDTPLFSSGIIDSFALVDLIIFLEEQCSFRISAMDVNLDNMDTIKRMLDFTSRALVQD